MNLGIVGHAAEKFTADTEEVARRVIRDACVVFRADRIVSGHCHMGGIDIWAEEEADSLGIDKLIHEPRTFSWSGPGGFMERNLRIARTSDIVLVIVVRELPPGYNGMRFPKCYHCHDSIAPHIKSGGCWTARRAPRGLWAII